MPSAPAPFVSFNDYLDANAGSLQQERGGVLGSADASISALGADTEAMKTAAYGQGVDQAKAAWSAQRMDVDPNKEGQQRATSSEQYRAPSSVDINFSTLPGQEQYAKHKAEAETQLQAMQSGGLGQGKSAFEAGMIGADTSFHDQAAQKQKSFQDSVNGYLDSVKQAGMAGAASFKPAPIVTYQPTFDPGSGGSAGAPGEGPYQKPRRSGTRRYENGVPVGGRGDYEP